MPATCGMGFWSTLHKAELGAAGDKDLKADCGRYLKGYIGCIYIYIGVIFGIMEDTMEATIF